MSVIKIYQWRGVDSLSLSLPVAGKLSDINFPSGSEKPKINARLETSDKDVQTAVESCSLFKAGQIKLISTRNKAVVAAAAVAAEADKKPKTAATKGVYPSVTTLQQAADKLIEKFEVNAEDVQTPDQIYDVASKCGATFPNLQI